MANRTLGIIAALGLLAPLSAYADEPGGDIVDQILKTLPPPPGRAAPMTSAAVTPPPPMAPPPPMTPPPPPPTLAPAATAPAPTSLEPSTPPPSPAAAAPISSTPIPPPPAPPVPANNGDILAAAAPPPPSTDSSGQWTGAYLGANVGYGFTRGGGAESCVNTVTGDPTGCDIISSPALQASGVFGGGQIGYLMPLSTLTLPLGSSARQVMIGIEADMQASGIDAKQNVSGPFNFVGFPGPTCSPCNFSASQGIDWFSTVRARLGVPVDDVFIYATGGVMIGAVRASQNLSFGGGAGNISNVKKTNVGPVVGGGLEFALSGPFTAKIEGLYYDLGDVKTQSQPVGGAPGNFFDFKTFGFHGAMIRVGINMKLGGLGGS